MNGKVTLFDLEKISGVSKTTISRYLSGEFVSSEKIKKIEKAITNSGYIKNNFAQLLRKSKSNLIGVIVPDLDNPFFLKIIKRIDELANIEGKTLIIKTTNRSNSVEKKAIEYIRGFMVEAIFICRSEMNDGDLIRMNLQIPVISIDKEFSSVTSIVSNNFQSSYDLTTHLISQAEGNVLFFSRSVESSSVLERIKGFKAACKKHRVPINLFSYDVNLPIDFERLFKIVKEKKIRGIICRNDNEAVKISSYFNDKYNRLEISRVKVCGFDNISLSKHVIPKLTTVDQKIEEMCDIGFKIFLKNEIKNPSLIVHDSELIIRESTSKE
jgi:DNA-binding LacI/PurR family transcriptional regulator